MQNKTILLAEDETIIAMDVKGMLKRNGFKNVMVFSDGETLLEKALAEQPDLIIADIILKNNTRGTNSAEKLWEKYSVPFVFISAINMIPYKAKYDPAKCEFLKKPFKEGELIDAIYRLIDKH